MSITIAKDSTEEVHKYTRRIEFDDAAPILLERRYSHGGKEFIPDEASAGWNHGEPIQDITVEGYVLKKDRTPGQQRAQLRYETPASSNYGKQWGWDPAPEWLLELFGINGGNN